MKIAKRILPILGMIVVFSPRLLKAAFNMAIPKPVTLGVIILGMILIFISTLLKEKKS